jgi:hypothetical protein
MTIKEKHLINGVTFREQIEHQFDTNQDFTTNVNRDLIVELAFSALEDEDLKEAIYQVTLIEDLDSKKEKILDLLKYYVDSSNTLIRDFGLDFNTDQAMLAYKLMILYQMDPDINCDWSVEIHFKKNYSYPTIVLEKN